MAGRDARLTDGLWPLWLKDPSWLLPKGRQPRPLESILSRAARLLRRLDELQRHPIALADCQVLVTIDVAQPQRGWQRPDSFQSLVSLGFALISDCEAPTG